MKGQTVRRVEGLAVGAVSPARRGCSASVNRLPLSSSSSKWGAMKGPRPYCPAGGLLGEVPLLATVSTLHTTLAVGTGICLPSPKAAHSMARSSWLHTRPAFG